MVTYLITFSCYGARVAGDEPSSVDREHRIYGTPTIPANPRRAAVLREQMRQPPYVLDTARRSLVLEAVSDACRWRNWLLAAVHVRTNHVHVVVDAPVPPENVLTVFKTRASRLLTESGFDTPDRQRWSRHGSTRYLWDRDQVTRAIAYTIEQQGAPMAIYLNPNP